MVCNNVEGGDVPWSLVGLPPTQEKICPKKESTHFHQDYIFLGRLEHLE